MSTAGKFTKIDKLGEGTYGVVYKARERASQQVFALKRMNIVPDDEGVPATTIREICLLKELRHRNIVTLSDVLFQSPKMTLIFEHCQWDLKKYMTEHNKDLSSDHIRWFLYQMLVGLDYMHQKEIVHRDLKPQNLLITENLELKLADFGLARVEGIPVKKYSHEAVTLWYRAPDVILGSANYGLAVDMWSVGCIFAEMATGTPLFNGRNDADQLLRMFKHLGAPTAQNWPSLTTYPGYKAMFAENKQLEEVKVGPEALDIYASETPILDKIGPDGVDLLRQMLDYEPCRRISARRALAHKYFNGLKTSSRVGGDGGAAANEHPVSDQPPLAAAAVHPTAEEGQQ